VRLVSGLGRRRFIVEAVFLIVVATAAVMVLRGPMTSQRFTIDESRWISTSRYFWITFVQRDVVGPVWQPNYVVLTHPPIARYVIGFGLWLQGWTPEQLNGRYDSLQTGAYNARAGNIPSTRLLAAARRATFPFAVGSMVLVYVIGRMLGGRMVGLAAAILALANPLLTTIWTRALAESILAFFSLLALALALRVLPKLTTVHVRPWLPVALGASLALAAATKLSGGIAIVGLGVYGLIQQVLALTRTRRTAGVRTWIDVGLAAVIVFIAVNPLLYPSPVVRTLALIQQRRDEMEFQQDTFESQAVPDGLIEHAGRVAFRVFVTNATPRGPLPLSPDVVLASVGCLILLTRARRDLKDRLAGPGLLFLLWASAFYAIITVNLGFDSAHYYAPLVTANMICSGIAIGAGVQMAVLAVRRRRWSLRRTGQNTQIPAT
jgi:4-amino-4-deoxy-L-arabinose transferase-like glycosyltransferase